MSTDNQSFGYSLKQLRVERKMTLEEMGRLLGTSKQVLSRYEKGQRIPKITTVKLYAERLGVDLRFFLGGGEERWAPLPDDGYPQRLWVVSGNGEKKTYAIDRQVAEWVCDLLDHPEKLNQALDAVMRPPGKGT